MKQQRKRCSFLLITELVGTGLQVGTGRATLKAGKEAKDSHEGASPILHGIQTFTLFLQKSWKDAVIS